MKPKKTLSIKQQYKEALSYLKESTLPILTITVIFIASIFIGFLIADKLTFIDKLLKEIIDKTLDLNTTELTFFILQNNLMTSFTGFLAGIFLGIYPLFITLTNGIVIGYVIERSSEILPLAQILKSFIPHGIFELPAVVISLGLGLKLSAFIFAEDGKRIPELQRRFYNSINVFLFIILPLLIIAAVIESLLITII